jgi:hypothetical protein
MKYLTIQEIQCVSRDACEQQIDSLVEALLDLESRVSGSFAVLRLMCLWARSGCPAASVRVASGAD